jgi:hypothetical protein
VSLIAFFSSGCGDDDPDSSTHELVGTWNLEQMIMNFTIMGQTIIDTLTPDEDTISGTATFEKDYEFTYTLEMQGQVDTMDGIWDTDGDSLTLMPSDTISDTLTFQYDVSGSTLILSGVMVVEMQGMQIPITIIQTWGKQKALGRTRIVG